MPHRTTYFFPRQFPDRNTGSSSKLVEDHEKKFVVDGGKSDVTLKADTNKDDDATWADKSVGFSHGVTRDKIHGKQLADFVKWLSDKKKKGKSQTHANPVKNEEGEDEASELLLPPPPPAAECDRRHDSLRRLSSNGSNYSNSLDQQGKERVFERQVSLQRLSSEGSTSYAGSLFSGTTLDGNWSSTTTGILKDSILENEAAEEAAAAAVEGIGARANVDNGAAQRCKEGYILQIMLAKRLTEQATLATEPLFVQERSRIGEGVTVGGSSDAEIVSYRLWV